VQRAQPGQVLFGREQFLDARSMANPHKDAGQRMPLFIQRTATEQDLTGGRLHQASQQAQQAGLAAAVGAADL